MSSRTLLVLLATWLMMAARPGTADIAVIVHPLNPLTTLTPQELRRIFLGRMPLFPDSNREIHAIDLPDNDPVFAAFYRQVVELEGVDLKRYRAYYLFSGRGRLPTAATSAQDALQKVAEDINAIAYVDSHRVTNTIRVLLLLPDNDQPRAAQ